MDWPIILGGKENGRITSVPEGKKCNLTASCPFEEGWIYRLYIGTAAVPRGIYLGVMLPEGKRFALRKQLYRRQMETLGTEADLCGTIIRCRPGESEPPEEAVPPAEPMLGPLPFGVSALGDLPEDGGFPAEIFRTCGGRYVSWEGQGYYLVSGKPGEVLGPAPFFCLLGWVPWEERGWWVLCVDDKGEPIPWPYLPE